MSFPEWVEKYRTKGKAINHVNGKYYLYEVHSERVKGTNIVKKINDKYLGKITENGLIAPKSKITTSILVKEYGIYCALFELNGIIINRIIKDYADDYKTIITHAFISLFYNKFCEELYYDSYLSIIFPTIEFNPTDNVNFTINRLRNMMISNMEKKKVSLKEIYINYKSCNIIIVNEEIHISYFSSNKYNINMESLKCLK